MVKRLVENTLWAYPQTLRAESTRALRSVLIGLLLIGGLIGGMLLGSTLALPKATWAAGLSEAARPSLTLPLLEQRIASPVRQGGAQVVDLRDFTIDLRGAENTAAEPAGGHWHEPIGGRWHDRPPSDNVSQAPFAEAFYRQLQGALNGAQPLGIDLSNSLIQGELDLSRLSLRVGAYGGPVLPALAAFNQAFQPLLSRSSLAGGSTTGALLRPDWVSPTGALARSLLIQPQSAPPDTLVFQGLLVLHQTCFNGLVNAPALYFLNRVEAVGAIFTQPVDFGGARFARSAEFSQAQFQQESSFRSVFFAGRTRFNQASFSGLTRWEGSTFHDRASFAQANFQAGNFARSHWQTNADFDQAQFHGPISFQKGRFDASLFLTDAQFEAAANFRQVQFQSPVSLRGAHILSQLDFGDARFARASTVNVADLDFNPGEAKILGSPGKIGQVFSVPALANNETVLRNLVRNFRLLEQIGDANQLEYTTERLRLRQIKRQIFGLSLNQARATQLVGLGLSPQQSAAVVAYRRQQPFVSRTDLLGLDEIDLASYLKVRDRITVQPTTLFNRGQRLIRWLLLAGLLLLSQYGTNVWLTFGVGLLATVVFALIFWMVDRYRRRLPTPIVPTQIETFYMLTGSVGLLGLALSLLGQNNAHVAWTLAAVALLVLPVPVAVVARLYQQGRYHDLMAVSYFVENGALRRLQVLIARLPTVPKYPFYRDRYVPLLSDRRWNWLNYFDFSLNNWFKFGFNDIRLRDREVPGLISALVWYQWSLGVVYIILLLWTLSRTIPGLNLLLYF